MKVLLGAFNQEKALVGAFSVIVKTGCGTDGALHITTAECAGLRCNDGSQMGTIRAGRRGREGEQQQQ